MPTKEQLAQWLAKWDAGISPAANYELQTLMQQDETSPFQERVHQWARTCFTSSDALGPAQRSFRFIEEAIELAQAAGTSREDVLRLVDYTYGRPEGMVHQEIGGTMVTLAALATAFEMKLNECAERELTRCQSNTAKIRAKDLAKPQRSPLPGSSVEPNG